MLGINLQWTVVKHLSPICAGSEWVKQNKEYSDDLTRTLTIVNCIKH